MLNVVVVVVVAVVAAAVVVVAAVIVVIIVIVVVDLPLFVLVVLVGLVVVAGFAIKIESSIKTTRAFCTSSFPTGGFYKVMHILQGSTKNKQPQQQQLQK